MIVVVMTVGENGQQEKLKKHFFRAHLFNTF